MFSSQQQMTAVSRLFAWESVALLALMLIPIDVRAENIILRNDTSMALVVDTCGVFAGRITRARTCLLSPRASTPPIALPGNKVITLYDARFPTRVLFRDTIPASTQNQTFSIQPDSPRLKLMPLP